MINMNDITIRYNELRCMKHRTKAEELELIKVNNDVMINAARIAKKKASRAQVNPLSLPAQWGTTC